MDRFFTEVEDLPRLVPFYLPIRKVGYLSNNFGDLNNKKKHPSINFVFILSGSRKVEIDQKEYQLNAPGLLIEHPKLVYEAKDETPFEIMYLSYNIRNLEIIENLLPEPFLPFFHLNPSIELWSRTSRLAGLCASARISGTADRIDRLAESLICDALIYIKTRMAPEDSLRNAIYKAASYMEFHYIENIDMDRLIKQSGFSKRTFLRRWREIFKQPPGRFIAELRVREAKKMLEETSLQISEIAAHLNFDDVFYFSRMFRKHEGISPSQYRKKATAK